MRTLSTDEIVRIVAAGGGIILDTKYKSTDELVRIAASSKPNGAKVILRNLTYKSTDELVRIGAAGKGNVIFDLESSAETR